MPIMQPLVILIGGIFALLALAAALMGEWLAALVYGLLAALFLSALIPTSEGEKQNIIDQLRKDGFFDD